jgi:regulator of replication initiation timing
MTNKEQLKEAYEDIQHLQKMCEKLVYENVRLNKVIRKLKGKEQVKVYNFIHKEGWQEKKQ